MELESCDEQRVHTIYVEELPKFFGEEKRKLASALKSAFVRLGK